MPLQVGATIRMLRGKLGKLVGMSQPKINRLLGRAIADGEIFSADTKTLAIHQRVFAELEHKAEYGYAARELIQKAQRYFS